MINGKKIAVVLPAFNAAKTLSITFHEIPLDIVDFVILADDKSVDNTLEIAKELNIQYIISHERNMGYGANQKTCYNKALSLGADIIVMLHPDYQYTPKLIHSMCYLIANGLYQVVIGSRILGKGAIKGKMPFYRYFFNRILTFIQNILMNQKLSEYHSGYRAYSREILEQIDFCSNSDDFVFDNQILAQAIYKGYTIAEISCPTMYFKEASSINFRRSVIYGFGVLSTSIKYFFDKMGVYHCSLFRNKTV
ncbi:MAG TPA: glycosyltransferase family 2 protein [Bacteroidales bacterium]|nr:glycosyltransferase family 2 protein [Bacteroidales bacterium]